MRVDDDLTDYGTTRDVYLLEERDEGSHWFYLEEYLGIFVIFKD